MEWIFLGAAAFLAGVVDAVIGGGGMVQIPALFAVLPEALPATLFGTNKVASLAGTLGSGWRYARNLQVPWRIILPSMAAAFVASFIGAAVVSYIPADWLRKALPFILLALLGYTVFNKVGLEHLPRHTAGRATLIATTGSALIGFYDGIFGPGTGAFLKLLFVRGLGFDFLNASAPSKFINVASNLSAIGFFGVGGYVLWGLAAWMAVCNFLGGQVGSIIAIRFGSGFLRVALIVVVSALILKTFYDGYLV
ncbi:sulfite exporter TauE/SafE family protein [Terrihabitans rhizophilus]|uniref:Probable membrane transporter protein n=1 Tax=Terrihabitans rhizophilus TaxID=3092662 RepID=A0ABU4RL94_9HYPH|nr:TSUP family transporter [Terrihabitans sp. PJ23]MDX6805604.1 TSUP family transporter [Terrihabitans sp. PJ23]